MKAYDVVTDFIIKQLESGCVPWNKPWVGNGKPQNLISGVPYKGINSLITMSTGEEFFLTYKQAKELGGQVKKGSKAVPIIYWNFTEKEDDDGDLKKSCFIKYSSVFRLSDIEQSDDIKNLVAKRTESFNPIDFDPIERAESIIESLKVNISHSGSRAFYNLSEDKIVMPEAERFLSSGEYYKTLFHELTHWTGHKSRLSRGLDQVHSFGDAIYSNEELIAELGAAFICTELDIEADIKNSAAYIQGWLKQLRGDKSLIIKAASKAKKAVALILKREGDK